ncbi:DNA repair protein RecN [Acidithiobacillus montserratensis]|uniref:DNA repair protein RecN n=1 Tax=Acidithiobacillus montserratensis TaxID=2729135 RepID=A0ACD5HFU1_9PROT|nr:DNA repair protein RecN [Acidithiobacillus montserratensis]MBU2748380.1 DNA repair protein RecN [Acidithiobacillus montserratensis]
MLLSLQVRNFALIDSVSIDLEPGLTVLTGETGAGKSLLVDAIALLLGDKGHADSIRHGAEQAEISAEYALDPEHEARHWLREQDMDSAEGICVLRRVIQRNGRSRAFINGSSVTLTQLRELGEHLIELLGQHEHQKLLHPDRQLALLDRFAGSTEILDQVADSHQQWRQQARRCEDLRTQQTHQNEQADWQRFQLQELEAAALQEEEWDSLRSEEQRLGAVEKLREHVQAALDRLEGEACPASRALAEAQRHLSVASQHDQYLQENAELLNGALIQTEESIASLHAYLADLEADPERLENIARRLQQLQDLQRKYHCDLAGLIDKRNTLRQELQGSEDLESQLRSAKEALLQAKTAYIAHSRALSSARQAQQQALAAAVAGQIRQLGMPHAEVELRLQSHPEDEKIWRSHGWDQAEIWITANPGHPPQPLAKVASGGELSRISLALQVILAAPERMDTLIFDEVDVGIGGAVAERVGRLLRRLGTRQQVLCVTHLAQVAAQGHQHLHIEKQIIDGQTLSNIQRLPESQRQLEIARMLGGIDLNAAVREAAATLLANVDD